MKPKSLLRLTAAAAIAFAITPAASAQVVNIDNQTLHYGTLLTDNFNTASNNWWEFNNSIAADQGGTLATLPYSTSNGNGYTAQHSNGGNMLLTSDGWGGWGAMASPNHNFATTANTTNKPLEIQFDMSSTGGDAPDWIGFGLSSGQGQLFYEGAYGFAATVGDGTHNYKLVISDTAGTGSGFNGITDGAKIDFYKDNVFQETITETLGTSDGYITFRTIPSNWTGWNIGVVDNLKITSGQQTNPFATTTELNLTNNGSLNFGDVTQTVAKLDGTAGTTVKLFNSSLTVDGIGDSSFAGVISGSGGSLAKAGSGALTLSGANTYSGATTINGGKLVLEGAGQLYSNLGWQDRTVTVNSGGTLQVDRWDGGGSLGQLGYNQGNIVINGGTIRYTGNTGITYEGPGFTIGASGATLESAAPAGQVWNINYDNRNAAFGIASNSGGSLTLSGIGDGLISKVISGSGGVTKTGTGTWTLTGANTYTGTTIVNEGTLSLTSPSLDNASSVVIGTIPGATMNLNFTGYDLISGLEINGSGTLPPGSYNSGHPTYGSYFTGSGTLVVITDLSGSWTSVIDGDWDEPANWDANTIATGIDQAASFNQATGVTVTLTGNQTIGNLAFDTSDYTLAGSSTLTLKASLVPVISVGIGRIATISAPLAGTGGIEKTGDGTLVFSGVKSYTGDTTVTGGTLELAGGSGGNSIIRGALTINPGTTVALTGGDGSGFGWNYPVPSITVNGGTLNAATGAHVGFGSGTTMSLENGGTIAGGWQWNGDGLLGVSTSGGSTNTINGAVTLRADAGASHTFNVVDGAAAVDLQVNANLSDQWPEYPAVPASGLTKAGSGTMVLNGTNTYDGNTVVAAGELDVTAAGSLRFRPTTNGQTNAVSGANTTLTFAGTVDLDLGAAVAAGGNSWNLFNLTSFSYALLTPAAVTSTLGAFAEVSSGTWELPVTDAKWVFTVADGNLAYVVTATDYDNWVSDNGVTGGPDDDDDNDGMSNREEYAFGLDPTGATSLNPIAVPLDKTTGTFSYTRRSPQSLTGLTYTIWYSTDLSGWTEDTDAEEGIPIVNGEVETVEVTLSTLPGDPLPDTLFIQVRAE